MIPLVLISLTLHGQSIKDSILIRERSIDRPVTLHQGQVRVSGGYRLSAVAKSFDENGEGIKLSENGTAYVRHESDLDIRYGILDNLQINIAARYNSQAQRKEQVLTTQTFGPSIEIFEVHKKTGLEDLLIAVSSRAPFTSRAMDIVATGGIYIPIGTTGKKPDHSVEDLQEGWRTITYRYNSSWRKGAPVLILAGLFKYRTRNYAFTPSVTYQHPLKESVGSRWRHQVVNNVFEYEQQPYTYQIPSYLGLSLEAERQLAPWFDLTLLFSADIFSGAWEEAGGIKIKKPDAQYFSFNPGYEILITPKIWLRQRLFVGVAGKNIEGPFGVYTSLVYNFFPF
jgi:hypothetical protein